MNLTQQLESLTLSQADELLEKLKENNYLISPYNAIQGIVGIIKIKGEWYIHFVDRILQIDSFQVNINELPYQVKQDIINSINEIL